MCDTTALTMGAPVSFADLLLTSTGAVWGTVDLITTSAGTPSGGDD
jgi:hypothetical protein